MTLATIRTCLMTRLKPVPGGAIYSSMHCGVIIPQKHISFLFWWCHDEFRFENASLSVEKEIPDFSNVIQYGWLLIRAPADEKVFRCVAVLGTLYDPRHG